MLNLKFERMRRGWSQAELARRAKLNPATVGQIEAARWRPYPAQLAKLTRALGISEAEAPTLLNDAPSAGPHPGRPAGRTAPVAPGEVE